MIDSRTATRKEKYLYHNTLCTLVKAVENTITTIDLRNESCAIGKVVAADAYMNLELENATYYDPRGEKHFFEHFWIQSRNIRYIHMPPGKTCKEQLELQINLLQNAKRVTSKKKRTFKIQRAQRYQKQIEKEISSKDSET